MTTNWLFNQSINQSQANSIDYSINQSHSKSVNRSAYQRVISVIHILIHSQVLNKSVFSLFTHIGWQYQWSLSFITAHLPAAPARRSNSPPLRRPFLGLKKTVAISSIFWVVYPSPRWRPSGRRGSSPRRTPGRVDWLEWMLKRRFLLA